MKGKWKLKGRLKAFIQATCILGALLLVIDLWMYTVNKQSALVITGFIVVYFAVMFLLYQYNRSIILREFVDFATQYSQIQRRLLRELELPHILLDESGKVIWTNLAFEKITKKEKGFRKSITSLFPTLTKEKLPQNDEQQELEVSYADRNYLTKMKRLSMREMVESSELIAASDYEGYLIAMYFFDITDLKKALKDKDEQSLAVGMIYLDNYDEALESVEEVRRSLLIALIDRKINKYVASLDGIVRKTEKDKYLVILRKKSLNQMMDNKFDILEDVKTVNIGNEMAVTLSIGVGIGALTYGQNYEFSRAAIDLALGRGGDQAVVKTPEQLTYYGGKSQQVEKGTRVKARVKAHALKEILAGKEDVLVMGHRLSDVDSFGAGMGICCIAKDMDKKARIILNEITTSVKPLVELVHNHPDFPEDMIIDSERALELVTPSTLLVIVDTNRPSITECPELLKICKNIVVLDHHRQGAEVVENPTLSYVEPYASSSCEMVAEILQYVRDDIPINSVEADCLYSGIVIDTNNFTAKTGVRTFEAAAFLKRNGADVTRVRKMFRDESANYMARAEAIRSAEIFMNVYAIAECPDIGIESPTVIAAQAANELLNINGIRASFVCAKFQGKVYISARSIDEVNVQIIMEKMGGGGHMTISGAQLEDISVDAAIDMLKATISKMTQEGDI